MRLANDFAPWRLFETRLRVALLGWSNTIRPHASLEYKPPAPEVFVPAFAAWPAAPAARFASRCPCQSVPSSLCLTPKFYPSLIMVRDQERSIFSPEGRLTWTRAWKIAFANAPMKYGQHMAAGTAKPSSTGLRPKGKCWRHRRSSSPANQLQRRSHGSPQVRRPPEHSRGLAEPSAC
jgi:hypothetical protein